MKVDVIIPASNKPVVSVVVNHLASLDVNIGNIVIVDLNRADPSLDVDQYQSITGNGIQVCYVFLDEQKYFNKSLALNVGFHYTRSEKVLICDADVLLDKAFFCIGGKRI